MLRVHVFGGGFDDDEPVLGIRIAPGAAAIATVAVTVPAPVNVAASASPVTILAANSARIAATIVNNGGANLHLNYAGVAGEVVVVPGGSATTPERFAGVVTGWWEGPISGNATVTEIHF